MSTQIILKVLARRHRLRQRDRWTRRQLEAHQTRELRLLREHTYAHSPFYGRFHKGFTDRPLDDLLVLTKEMVMEHLDELVTDPTVRLADVEAHLASLSGLEIIVGRLNYFRPKVLVAYASMAHLLAEEQLAGRLHISPSFVFFYVALTSFRSRTKGVSSIVTLAGLTSIGWIAAVNFIIDSDYK